MAEKLLEKETLNFDDVVQLIGKRPFAYQGIGSDFLHQGHTASPVENADVNVGADDVKNQ